ncbi:KR domain-containing protein, partial [Streptomyces palmae]|uniref:KR domain-containing protein n=1 Tax=Streptomyces palmae TaxID=1701085 RepID=UPI0035EF0A2D
LTLTDTTNQPILTAQTITTRATTPTQLRSLSAQQSEEDGLFRVRWTAMPNGRDGLSAESETKAKPAGEWAVLGTDVPGMIDAPGGEGPDAGPRRYADLAALVAAVDEGTAPVPPAVLVGVPPTDGIDAADTGVAAVAEVLRLAQQWVAEPRLADARLVVVTQDATSSEDEALESPGSVRVDPVAAGVWGLIRSAQAEHPDRFLLLDLVHGGGNPAEAPGERIDPVEVLSTAIAADEWQLAVRGGQVMVPRLVAAREAAEIVPPAGAAAWRLVMAEGRSGTVDGVVPEECPQVLEPLAPGQVRISVRAAGINFRDVMISLGMVPDQRGLGGEGAGVVLETAPDVTAFAPGDRVMGLFEGAFGPIAVADARGLTTIPPDWTYDQAAAAPVAYLTAWYGLVDLADLQPHDNLLIHAATGGVGMAATHIARHLGAHIHTTAHPDKHHVLEALGIDADHRASSRTLDFETTYRTTTNGHGMDVVLNSLAGEYTDASLRLLAPGGRFIEMGKTDIRDPEHIATHHPHITYHHYDLVTAAGLDHIAHILTTLNHLFTTSQLPPLPTHTWPLTKTRHALRHMSQARHTGKLTLTIPPTPDPNGTILITGGTGTLGALTAEHLTRHHGIRHLLLLSRQGPNAPGAQQLTQKLQQLGATVHITATDTTDLNQLTHAINTINPQHPLTGIIHTAGTLHDATLTTQTPHHLTHTWHPK